MKKYIGATIWIFPSDTYKKFAIVKCVNEFGIEVEILKTERKGVYEVGDIVFFTKTNLIFKVLEMPRTPRGKTV